MFELPILDQFAREFLSCVVDEIGSAEKLSVKVLLCDEEDWAYLAPWATAMSGAPASDWEKTDAFALSLALARDPTGLVSRTTEPERLERLVQHGFRLEFAKLASPYDFIVLLRDAWLPNQSRRLHVIADRVIRGISILRDPLDTPQYAGKRAHSLNVSELYTCFETRTGKEKFRQLYLETAPTQP
jgi:hypothetical protein